MQQVRSSAAVMLVLGSLLTCASACKTSQLEPQFASSTDQPSYAKRHPAELKSALEDFDNQSTLASTLSGELKDYPAELKEPDWQGVITVVEYADLEGRSPHYAESLEQNGKVAAFYEEEKPEIHKRVGGAVQYQAKEKGCDADMYSPAVHALDKSIDKQLEERTRRQSEAHAHIAMNESALGKANIEALERQSDRIALYSYITHVGLVRKKLQIDQLLADADAVDRTLKNRIDEIEKAPPHEKATPAETKARQDELESLKAAKASLAEELGPARQQAQNAEERITQARKTYSDALTALKQTLEQNAALQKK
jgi:hypothetical protein